MVGSRRIEFPGSQGSALVARLDLPDAEPHAYALFAHGFGGGEDAVAADRISRSLTDAGISVLQLDLAGPGSHGGEPGDPGSGSSIEDLLCAADHLRAHFAAPAILIGHSLGGAAVLATAHRVPEARAVVTIGTPVDAEHVGRLLGDSPADDEERAEVPTDGSLAGSRRLLAELAPHQQAERIASLDAALLVLHSPTDQVVGVDNARRIFVAARHPKSFVALDGADHMLTDPDDAAFAAAVLVPWATRYLKPAPADSPAGHGPTRRTVVVSEERPGSLAQHITIGPHRLAADEPRPVGDDTAPTPYDLLLAALGACTSMTVRMYADRKQWPLTGVTVSLRHSRIHASDCADCDLRVGMLDRIERVIALSGELDDDQRRRLFEIADKCPVHRTLHSEIVIDTSEGDHRS